MPRQLLDEDLIHPSIKSSIGGGHSETIAEVKELAASNSVAVVGMRQNPVCKKVCKNLDSANVGYSYLEYGSYFKEWPRRLALKIWSGWPTFPMIFVNGQLVGGNQEVEALLTSGELKKMLADAGGQ
jgi:glutaredoxin-related protein